MNDARREEIRRALAGAIARSRLSAGKTQEQVAEVLEIGPEAISRIERGVVDPPITRLFELAELFGVGIGELVVPPSDLEADQARMMARLLSGLSAPDREHVIEIAVLAAKHLREKAAASTRTKR